MADKGGANDGLIVKHLVDNADRLGLTWKLTLATVVNNDPLMVICDADTEAISATSMSGVPKMGDRVYLTQIPPSGNYIVGPANDGGTMHTPWVQSFTATGQNSLDVNVPLNVDIYSLTLDWTLRDDLGGFQAAALRMLINGDSSNNYAYRLVQASGATASALTHTQVFPSTFASAGIYATGGATATRFSNGRIVFPAWNSPHSGQLGYTFESTFENAANDGWMLHGGGFFGNAGPYYRVSLLAQVGANWAAGSQVVATGLRV